MEALLSLPGVETIANAHSAMMESSSAMPMERCFHAAICSLTAFAICGLFHALVARHFKRQYFCLHVFANTVITALTLPGSIRALLNANNSVVIANGAYQPNALYMCWIYALHIYHPIFFKTGSMDWVHHIPVYIINTLTFSIPSGDAVCLQSLVMTGIPGGLDYLLQVLEGEGKLSRAAYKGYCSSINNWIRAPFGSVAAFISFLGLYHGWHVATIWERTVLFLLSLHAFWNPPFFCRQAVEANVIDTINRFGMVGGEIKLPKVRALSSKENRKPGDKEPAYPIGAGEVKKTVVEEATKAKKP